MNTRLQVEHPVTELRHRPRPRRAAAPGRRGRPTSPTTGAAPAGHAVEVRLYAEDPARDWQPQSGRLTRFEVPARRRVRAAAARRDPARRRVRVRRRGRHALRRDARQGRRAGHRPGPRRVRRLAAALERAEIHGVRTNRDLLVEVLRHPGVPGRPSSAPTSWSGTTLAALDARRCPTRRRCGPRRFAAAVGLAEQAARPARPVQRADPGRLAQRRLPARSAPRSTSTATEVGWGGSAAATATGPPTSTPLPGRSGSARRRRAQPCGSSASSTASRGFEVHLDGDRVDVESAARARRADRVPRFVDPADQVASGSLLAPMPGLGRPGRTSSPGSRSRPASRCSCSRP